MRLSQIRNTLHVLGGTLGGYLMFALSLVLIAALDVLGVGIIPLFIALISDPEAATGWLSKHVPSASGLAASPDRLVVTGCWVLILLFPLKNALTGAIGWMQLIFVARREISLSARLLAAIMARPYAYHLQRSTPELQRMVISDSYAAFHGGVLPFAQLISESLVVAFVAALLYYSQPLAALTATLLVCVFVMLFYQVFRKRLAAIGLRQIKASADLVKAVSQSLGGIKEVKLMGREPYFVREFVRQARVQARNSITFSMIGQSPRLVLEALIVICLGTAVLVLLHRDIPVNQSLPYLALFGVAAIRLLPSATRILSALTMIRTSLPAIDGIFEVMSASSCHPEGVNREAKDKVAPVPKEDGLTITGVDFSYPGSSAPALSGITFILPRGRMTGIVGGSGAGKSTLVDIILGLQTPLNGAVALDGRNIARFQTAWQRSIGYVPQDIFLSDGTIRANVAFGLSRDEIDDELVWRSLELAMLANFVRSLPLGLDTPVGENGARLSGGQRQRVGIARALFGGKSFLVMDEATSALDNQTENEVGAVLQALKGDRTQIIVAHRLNTVKRCDWLIYLDRGTLAGQGTYDDMSAQNEGFRRLMGDLDSASAG